jgi:transposase InsO family protein
LPLVALGQSITWVARHGDARAMIHHSDHGTQHISALYGTRLEENGILASTDTVDDPYRNALAASADGAYKSDPISRSGPFEAVRALERRPCDGCVLVEQLAPARTPRLPDASRAETIHYANWAALAAQ